MREAVLRWLVLAILVTGCGSASSDAPDVAADATGDALEPVEQYEAELFETTKVIDSSNQDALIAVESDYTLRFKADSEIAQGLAVHDVVLAQITPLTPKGLLRQVTELETEDDALVARTVAAPLQLAFRHLHVTLVREVPIDNGVTGDRNQPADALDLERALQPLGTGPLVVDFYAFNGDGDTSTTEDQVRVTGTFEGNIGYHFEMSIDWPDFTSWPPDALPDLEASLDVTLGASAGLNVAGMAAKGFSRKESLSPIPLPPFTVGFLVFNPEITIDVAMEGGAAGAYALTMGASASLTTGASVNTSGGTGFDPPSPAFDFDPPVVTSSWHAYARASAGPTLHLRLYDTVGPYAGLQAFALLEADHDGVPCWTLKGGLDGLIGFDMEVAGMELADWSTTFGIAEKDLATGDCEQNPEFDDVDDVIEPEFAPWSKVLSGAVSGFATEDVWTRLTQTVDGHYLAAGSGVRYLTKLDRNGKVLWSRQYTLDSALLPVPMDITTAADGADTEILATGHEPPMVLKLDSSGEVLWSTRPELPFLPARGFHAQVPTSNGETVLVGSAQTADMAPPDVWITRLDAHGEPLWSRRWGAADRAEEPTDVVMLGEAIIVVGRSFAVAQSPANQSFAMELTGDGETVWVREYSGCGDLYSDLTMRRALVSRDGDILVSGRYDFSSPKAILLKLKPDGSVPWANGASGEFLGPDINDLVQLSDGGLLATGTWWTAKQDDLFLARTDSVGRFLWLQRYDSGVADSGPGLILSGQGGALLAANTQFGEKDSGLWVMRLPVQDGAISFSGDAGFVATATDWDDLEDICILDAPSTLPGPEDWFVAWQSDPVSSSTVSPAISNQAP